MEVITKGGQQVNATTNYNENLNGTIGKGLSDKIPNESQFCICEEFVNYLLNIWLGNVVSIETKSGLFISGVLVATSTHGDVGLKNCIVYSDCPPNTNTLISKKSHLKGKVSNIRTISLLPSPFLDEEDEHPVSTVDSQAGGSELSTSDDVATTASQASSKSFDLQDSTSSPQSTHQSPSHHVKPVGVPRGKAFSSEHPKGNNRFNKSQYHHPKSFESRARSSTASSNTGTPRRHPGGYHMSHGGGGMEAIPRFRNKTHESPGSVTGHGGPGHQFHQDLHPGGQQPLSPTNPHYVPMAPYCPQATEMSHPPYVTNEMGSGHPYPPPTYSLYPPLPGAMGAHPLPMWTYPPAPGVNGSSGPVPQIVWPPGYGTPHPFIPPPGATMPGPAPAPQVGGPGYTLYPPGTIMPPYGPVPTMVTPMLGVMDPSVPPPQPMPGYSALPPTYAGYPPFIQPSTMTAEQVFLHNLVTWWLAYKSYASQSPPTTQASASVPPCVTTDTISTSDQSANVLEVPSSSGSVEGATTTCAVSNETSNQVNSS